MFLPSSRRPSDRHGASRSSFHHQCRPQMVFRAQQDRKSGRQESTQDAYPKLPRLEGVQNISELCINPKHFPFTRSQTLYTMDPSPSLFIICKYAYFGSNHSHRVMHALYATQFLWWHSLTVHSTRVDNPSKGSFMFLNDGRRSHNDSQVDWTLGLVDGQRASEVSEL